MTIPASRSTYDPREWGAAQTFRDPMYFAKLLWPDVTFYDKQREIIYSVLRNDKTLVRAGHKLGKDFVTAFIVLWFFLTRHPCRVVTTSVDGSQLEGVLWGEIRRFIQMSRYPLEHTRGGPLVVNHLHLRKVVGTNRRTFRVSKNDGLGAGRTVCGLSYVIGRVAAKGEGMQGHHVTPEPGAMEAGDDGVPRTLFVADEASGVDDQTFNAADTWAARQLFIGNPYPCNNAFYRYIKAGDVEAGEATDYDAPNGA